MVHRHAQLVYVNAERAFTKRSKPLLRMYQIHGSGDQPLKWRYLVPALVCHL